MGDSEHWAESLDKKSAIFISGASDSVICDKGAGTGFAWARINHVFFYSCYCTPNCTVQEFDLFLGGLEESIRNKPSTNLIVAGDFNSHSAEWGSATLDTRGSMLSDLISTLRLRVCNVGTRPTYRRVNATSVIDVTFERALPAYHPLVADWMVVEEAYSASDHQYITYRVSATALRTVASGPVRSRVPGWSVRKLNPDAAAVFWETIGPPHQLPEGTPASQHAERLNALLTTSCDAAMPRRVKFKARRSVHWWNESIAELRKKAIAARRVYQRLGRRTGHNVRTAELDAYKKARAELKLAIRRAQEDSWAELCRTVDSDPWGVPYRLVTKRLGRRSPAMDPEAAMNVARGLFPSSPPIDWSVIPTTGAVPVVVIMNESDTAPRVPLFTIEEVTTAVSKLPSGKAPGPDLIPNEIIKLTFKKFPQTFVGCYNACLEEAVFPSRWKRAKLVLLHKGQGKPKDAPSSYRPISLLDGAGKVLERLLLNRLNRHIESVGALSNLQFGFRRSRSTVDAINEVVRAAEAAGSGPVQNRDLCVIITVDVKNAFNSAPWRLIDAALQRHAAPVYLVEVLRDYMSSRELEIDEDACLPVSRGVPQGSVLGPTLWNLFYDDVLRLPVRDGIKLVAFADDIAIVATAHNAELMEQLVNPTLDDIVEWMTENGLQLAPDKSECVVLTKKRAYRDPELYIQGCRINVQSSIRYLGVQLDTRLSFGDHVEKVALGARKAAAAIGRLMPNVGGPSQSKRRLLMSVVHSRLLYGAPVWSDEVMGVKKYKHTLLQAQRCAALKVARCYRTVSDLVATVLARMPPVFLLAADRRSAAAAKKSRAGQARLGASGIIEQWQALWDSTTSKAAWTIRLIPDLSRWWYNGPREVSFHMAQVLSGHGCFQNYLWVRGRVASPACVQCEAEIDDAEHTVFHCPFWDPARAELLLAIGRPIVPEDVMELMCGPEINQMPADRIRRRALQTAAKRHGDLFCSMVERIMGQKEEMERQRQRLN